MSLIRAEQITGSVASASYALTASYVAGGASAAFPYSGSAIITGSLLVSGSGLTVVGNQTITGSIIFNSGSRITSTYYGNAYPGYIDIVAGAPDGFVELLSYNQSSSVNVDDYSVYITTNSSSQFNLWEFKSDGRLLAPRGIEALSFTGSVQGTASYAKQSLSSSYALTTSLAPNYVLTSATSSMSVATASYVLLAVSSSYSTQALSSSYSNTASYYGGSVLSASYAGTASYIQLAQSASYVLQAVSTSFASTASFVNSLNQNVNVTGSLIVTGSNILIGTKTITGSVFISGSKTIIGTNTITGSLNISGSSLFSGSLNVSNGITGSLFGTSSYAQTSSYALNSVSSSYAATASYIKNAVTASYILNAISSSYAVTASKALNYTETDPVYTAATSSIAFLGIQNVFTATQTINDVTSGEAALQIKNISANSLLASRTGVFYVNFPPNLSNSILQWDVTQFPHRSIFIKYVINQNPAGTTPRMRSGNLMAVSDRIYNGSNINWNEVVTNDLNANTSLLTFTFQIQGNTNVLSVSNADTINYEIWLEFTLL